MTLVKFESEAGDIIMISDYADQILKMIGHSGVVPSALLPTEIEPAIKSLEIGLAHKELANVKTQESQHHKKNNIPSLRTRAYPFRELLKRARDKQCGVTWKLLK